MPARLRGALYSIPLLALVACGGGGTGTSVNPTANDPKPTTFTANFDPTVGEVPLPNVLATAATTTTLAPTAGVPFTPDKALVWLNQREAGNTNAVSGVNAPFYMAFSGTIDAATLNAGTVKVFQCLPDSPTSPSSLENNTLGFRDVSAQFTYQVLASGKEIYVTPQVPMLPGARYLYVVTTGLQDTAGHPAAPSGLFKDLEYVKGGATSYATDTTNLADTSDPTNPAGALGAALEPIAANVVSSGQVAFSGYRKVMWDLIASAASDASGKGAYGAGPTGISSRSQIALLGRTITTSVGFTQPDPVGSPSTLAPLETLMYAWANNAGTFTAGNGSRVWDNTVHNFQVIGSSAVPSGNPGSLADIFAAAGAPSTGVGMVAWGSFESADIQVD
ncbi:MAG TPA: hypothetical protein VFT46_00615, partial [Holophagaceae bacterium]|nr:hypothetical protein [Holophagaceae bacterium]